LQKNGGNLMKKASKRVSCEGANQLPGLTYRNKGTTTPLSLPKWPKIREKVIKGGNRCQRQNRSLAKTSTEGTWGTVAKARYLGGQHV